MMKKQLVILCSLLGACFLMGATALTGNWLNLLDHNNKVRWVFDKAGSGSLRGQSAAGVNKIYFNPESGDLSTSGAITTEDITVSGLTTLNGAYSTGAVAVDSNITAQGAITAGNPSGGGLSWGWPGSVNGINVLSKEDVHAEDTAYGAKGVVVGGGRQNHSHDGALWIESEGSSGVPTAGSQESKIFTDNKGLHFRNTHSGGLANQGSVSKVFDFDNTIHVQGSIATSGTVTGNGSGLSSLNGSNIASGTVPDGRLSSNVPLKNAANTFAQAQSITGSGVGDYWQSLVCNNTNGQYSIGIFKGLSGGSFEFHDSVGKRFAMYNDSTSFYWQDGTSGAVMMELTGGATNRSPRLMANGSGFVDLRHGGTTKLAVKSTGVEASSIDITDSTSNGQATIGSGTSSVTVNTTAVTTTDKIVVNYSGSSNSGGALWVESITGGTSFVIKSTAAVSAATTVNWGIIH